MKSLFLAALAASLAFAGPSEDDQSVRDLVAKYSAARENRDPASIRALFTEEADQLVSSGVWRHGRETLVEGMLGSSQANPGSRTLAVERVRFITPDAAIADARYEIKGSNGAPDRKMWSTFVAVRTEDGWRLSAIRNMLPAPRR